MALLKSRTGTDFSWYRPATLRRRLQYHVIATGCRTMVAYFLLLEQDPQAVKRLHDAFLIKVGSFFRSPASWKRVEKEVGRLAAHHKDIRAWSAGCATGEEAYTLALIIAGILGTGRSAKWKVFATDLDEGAIVEARAARFSADQVRVVPKPTLRRHFVREGDHWRIGMAVRSRVVFGRHDLLLDPPLAEMDLVVCRNVLVYFNAVGRHRALDRLSSAVKPRGLLLLGEADTRGAPPPGFRRFSGAKLFQRTSLEPPVPEDKKMAAAGPAPLGLAALGGLVEESSSILAFAVGRSGDIVLWNRAAEDFFGLVAGQTVGRSLAKAVGTGTARQLKALMKAGKQGGNITYAEGHSSGGPRQLIVECLPARAPAATLFLATARPVESASPPGKRPVVKLKARQPSSGARRRSSGERWRADELETLSEELEGLNQELAAVETAAQRDARRAARAEAMLRRVIDTAARPFILCDENDVVLLWNDAAAKRYGLSSTQAVGKDLFGLVPALDHAPLQAACRKARRPGGSGRDVVIQNGILFLVDRCPFPGHSRSYLLRIGHF